MSFGKTKNTQTYYLPLSNTRIQVKLTKFKVFIAQTDALFFPEAIALLKNKFHLMSNVMYTICKTRLLNYSLIVHLLLFQ